MFRSVRFYSLASPWLDSEQDLSAKLADAVFKPCGPYNERSSGFEPPTGDDAQGLVRRVGGADLLRLRSQTRLLPAAALNEALEVRLEEYRARMQQEPGRRTKRQLREQTRDELLPKALLKSERTTALVILSERVLAVGSASQSPRGAFPRAAARGARHARSHSARIQTAVRRAAHAGILGRRATRVRARARVPDARSEGRVEHRALDERRPRALDRAALSPRRDGDHASRVRVRQSARGVLDEKGALTKLACSAWKTRRKPKARTTRSRSRTRRSRCSAARCASCSASLRRTLGGEPADAGRHTVIGTMAKPVSVGLPDASTASAVPAPPPEALPASALPG